MRIGVVVGDRILSMARRPIRKRFVAVYAALGFVFTLWSGGAVAASEGFGKLSLGVNGRFGIMPNANKFAAVYSETSGFRTTTTQYSTSGAAELITA